MKDLIFNIIVELGKVTTGDIARRAECSIEDAKPLLKELKEDSLIGFDTGRYYLIEREGDKINDIISSIEQRLKPRVVADLDLKVSALEQLSRVVGDNELSKLLKTIVKDLESK